MDQEAPEPKMTLLLNKLYLGNPLLGRGGNPSFPRKAVTGMGQEAPDPKMTVLLNKLYLGRPL